MASSRRRTSSSDWLLLALTLVAVAPCPSLASASSTAASSATEFHKIAPSLLRRPRPPHFAAARGSNSTNSTTFDPLAWVDPLIGASNGGNVFPGASLPYGMAKAVADTNSGSNQGGFTLDGSPVTGFSMMHDSGTGGSPSLGNFPLFAYTACADDGAVDGCVYPKKGRATYGHFRNASVTARPGLFGIGLDTGIYVNMTVAHHTALFRFTFPDNGTVTGTYLDKTNATKTTSYTGPVQPLILQDLSDLADSRQDNATIQVDPATGRITGSARFLPSFGSGNFVLYFCTDFDGATILDSGIYANSRASTAVHNLTISRSINGYPLPGGAFVRFTSAANPITARVATSFISVEQACQHAETEIPSFDFESVAQAATDAWRAKLRPIRIVVGNFTGALAVQNQTHANESSVPPPKRPPPTSTTSTGTARPTFRPLPLTPPNGTSIFANATSAGNSSRPAAVAFTTPDDMLRNFYSGIYRTMINPQDYTGENPLWSSSEPYFDSFYCIWDLFRSQMPFLTIIDPDALARMIRSLVDTYRHVGWLPDCRMSLCKGYTQGGSNADNVLADAFTKGIQGGIDWDAAYAAVLQDAEVEPYDWSSEGRGGLDSWKALGYIPVQDFDYKGFGTMTRSVSRTLEYSYNDYCIAQMAHGGLATSAADEATYLDRSGNWQNLYKADQPSQWWNGTDTGFTGFFQPRNLNGTWSYQNPLNCSNPDESSVCSLQNTGAETFESSLWEYGFFVPHDQATLIQLYGGDDAFVRRLDYLHDHGIVYIGNEPAFLTVFQYHYAGRPGLSAKRAHTYVPQFFSPTPDGLPGNDDSGAMGSFLAFTMMGLFPNPGQNVYLIIPPFFEAVHITHPLTNKTAVIRSTNFDATYEAVFIQSATLNGAPYTKNWVDHAFFTEGHELVLTLGRNESATWGRAAADRPPSVGEYHTGNANTTAGTRRETRYRGHFERGGL
ncbi:alpha-1,2-mannosidase family protein [Sporothrix schenckii 1099-18]|uniref:Alpha-1,2-mannosidase family protein n=1 Tax=Sporothrix schenckii 1099-18 TaxID=1397361 RepID=A0A0F2M809_SPOSC|nr:alpha-1,2-mannosidase family protein [Sporothrix schenckii 1099-18]KJR84316.1 alpha-1,2-mannosidase family protein [Sporothrix schenckii 1099-18]